MLKRPVTSDDLARLEQERAAADRAYNDALTALDRALPHPALPDPLDPAVVDPGALRDRWRVVPEAPPPVRGLRTRLARFVWRLIVPWFERQQAFNAAVLEHADRAASATRQAADSCVGLAAALREYAGATAAFHSHLIQYVQQITLYVDTKDRRLAGGMMAVYDPAIDAVADELLKRWESMMAREQRFAARVAALDGAHDDVRATLATLQQSTLTVKRELERMLAAAVASGSPVTGAASASEPAAAAPVLDSYKYVGFEERFRGAQDEIRKRLADYVGDFAGARDVLDVGCGRGEFLDLLREAGVPARGLDLNHEMVEVCRARGLAADEGDVLTYLRGLPDGALGGLFAAQVIEHLDPAYLMRTLDAAYHALRPGSRVVLETINPACWYAFFASYLRDLTHVKPIHPDTLRYLLSASGFQRVEIRYRAPYPEHEKLQTIARGPEEVPGLQPLVETMNTNAERLNSLLFTYLDYAAVATRL